MRDRITHVTSRQHPLLVTWRKLARSAGDYRKLGRVVLEGEHLCRAWVDRGAVPPLQAVVAESAWQSGRYADLVGRAAAVVVVADALLAHVSALETPPAIAFVIAVPASPPIDARAPSVVLDRLQDAGNVGSILRSAAAFGFAQVIAVKGTALLWSSKVVRAAMGAHAGLRLIEGIDADVLASLAVPLYATSSHARERLEHAALERPCAWVFGNEGQGVGEAVLQRASKVVRIDQPGGGESLNVAAAAAICLHASSSRLGSLADSGS